MMHSDVPAGTNFENAPDSKKGAASKQTKYLTKQQREIVRLPLTVDKSVYARLFKFRRDKGLTYDQDVLRMAIAYFLEKNGY